MSYLLLFSYEKCNYFLESSMKIAYLFLKQAFHAATQNF